MSKKWVDSARSSQRGWTSVLLLDVHRPPSRQFSLERGKAGTNSARGGGGRTWLASFIVKLVLLCRWDGQKLEKLVDGPEPLFC